MTNGFKNRLQIQAAFFAVLLITGIVATTGAQTQWIADGKQSAASIASQVHLSAIPDGFGGIFIGYENNPSGDADIYANRIDASGTKRWSTGGVGVTVVSGTGNQRYPALTPDGSGGVFVVWQDEVTTDIVAQHYNSAGAAQWAAAGNTVCSATGEQTMVKAESDGAGGVIMVWQDKRDDAITGIDLYAQRLNGAGVAQWTANGVAVCTATGNQSYQVVTSDKAGGVVVAWSDTRNGSSNSDIYAQRLNSAGTAQFVSNGVAVCVSANNQMNPSIASSGTRWMVSWDDSRGASTDIYAQALDGTGAVQWTANGVAVCSAANAQTASRLAEDGSNGVLCVWGDNRTGYDIFAQRLNSSGAAQWTANGVAVNQSAMYQYSPEIVPDGSGGAIVLWNDNRSGSDINLFAQRVNGSGASLWAADGLPVVTQTGTQQNHVLVPDGSGGAIAMWQDARSGASDIYSQLLNDAVTVTSPAAGVIWAGTQANAIQWTNRTTANKIHHYVILGSAAPGDGFPISIAPNVAASAVSQSWTASTVNSVTVQIKIRAVNSQSVLLDEYLSPVFTVDSNPPAVFDLTSPANAATTDLKPAFTWQTTTDALTGLDHYELWIDNTLVQDNLQAAGYQLTDAQKLTSASHTWTVKAVDKAGQIRQAASTRNLTASDDTTPPNPFHLLSPANNAWTAQTQPTFTWETAVDAGRGMGKYQLYVDGVLVQDAIPPGTTSSSAATLTVGSHTWFVKAVDLANNSTQSVETWTVKVDNVQPAAFDINSPANNLWTNTAVPSFTWSASSDAGSGLSGYRLIVDGAVKVDNIPAGTTAVSIPAGQPLAEGTHTWSVAARDVLGNTRNSTSTFTIGIDLTAPQAPALSTPANAAWVIQASPAFTWSAATDSRSGIKEYQLILDGAVNRTGLTALTATPASPLTEGSHTWNVKAVDNAGNFSTSTAFSFNGDFTPPLSFALISPASGATLHINRPQYKWRSTSDARSGFQKFVFYVDGVLKNSYLGATDTSITLTETLGNGQHKWKVVAWDVAGNIRDSGEAIFTVQLTPPVITSSSTATATEHAPFTYTATATDADGDPLTYSFENYPAWLTPSGSSISGTPPENSPASGSFKVNVSDGIFTSSQTVQMTITLVNDPPVFSSPTTATATEHQSFTYTAVAADPESGPVTYTFQNYPQWMTPSGNTISGTTPKGAANTSFKIIANDGQTSSNLTVSVMVVAVNDPPVITSPNSATATEHQPFTYTAAATDPEGAPITYIFTGYPVWLTPSGNKLAGTPREGDKNTTFSVTASDGEKTATQIVNLTVIAVNDPPVFSSTSSATATEHQSFTYTAVAADPESGPVTYTFQIYPQWMTPSGNTISGTTPKGAANTSFKVTANDGQTSSNLTVSVTVVAVNDPPVITSANSATATEDQAFTYTAAGTDPEGVTVTFSFTGLPPWLTASGATVTGTPREGHGNTTFSFTASDGQMTASRTVNLTVIAVNDPPVFSSPSSATATEHQAFTYTAVATDPEGSAVTCIFSNIPAWLTASGNTISGTTPKGAANTSFTVTASDGQLLTVLNVPITITKVNDPPVITSANSATATEDQPFTYTAAATDPEGATVTFIFTGLPPWLTASGATVAGTPLEGHGNTTFSFTASDGQMTASRTVNLTVIAVNDPPVFSSPSTASATEHHGFTYTAAASDPEGAPVTYAFSGVPGWLVPSGNKLSGTPGEGESNASFSVAASDGSLLTTLNVVLTVTAVNDPPVITSAASVTAKEDVPFLYTAAATDPENNTVRFSLKNLPRWLTASGNSVRGSVPETGSDTTFTVIADDGNSSDTLTVSVRVELVNDPPAVTSAGSATATEHQPFIYTATAADPENNPVTFTFSNFPAWTAPAGNRLTGTPREGDKNTTFTVVASDGNLATPPMTVNLTVIAVNDPPVITSSDSVSATEEAPFSYTAAASDPENDPVRIRYQNLPAWLSVSANSVMGTLPETGRDTTFVVLADDGKTTDTLSVFIKAQLINDPPRITSPAHASATEKQAFSYTATATDPDGPRFSIRFLEYPEWLEPSGPVLAGIPNNVPETDSFKVVATDGSLSDTLVVALQVTQVNDPPKFEYVFPDPTVEASTDFQLQLNLDDYASDPDDPDSALTWTYKLLNSVRVGVVIHPKTHLATFLGIQVEDDFGVALTVADPHGGSVSDTIFVTVNLSAGLEVRRIAEAPKTFTLYDNYPNPFNPATIIRYGLPRSCRISVKVYNVQGREVAVLIDGRQNAGVFEARWDASSDASGIYFYVIQTDSWRQVKRMTLMK
jgi:hypothetical protein